MGMESARFAGARGASECTMCRLAPPEFERAVAFAVYDEEVREMLHLLKFNGMRKIADAVLGDGMANAVLQLEGSAATELVVIPVPLFAVRQRSRGFNQSQVLAEAGLARLRKLRPSWRLALRADVLHRVRDTNPLFAMNPRARRKSLQGAFRVENADAIRGREVLLVDDIMTTGATARECSRVLTRAGAAKVWVVTMARAQAEVGVARMTEVAMWDMGGAETRVSEAGPGAPGWVGVFEEDEVPGWVGVSGGVGVSESDGLPGCEGRLEEKTSGRGAMEASGCWTTKRLGWRKPMGWAAKSAVAMPVAVAGGAAGSSGWATRGWRRLQKYAATGGVPRYSMARWRWMVVARCARRCWPMAWKSLAPSPRKSCGDAVGYQRTLPKPRRATERTEVCCELSEELELLVAEEM